MLLPSLRKENKMANSKISSKFMIDEVLWYEATSIRDDEPYLADVRCV